ncbi:MAG TPA: L,D-transpeptidase family protein [Solirubrobacteraceae bacterium]|jgi:hypothetical protein
MDDERIEQGWRGRLRALRSRLRGGDEESQRGLHLHSPSRPTAILLAVGLVAVVGGSAVASRHAIAKVFDSAAEEPASTPTGSAGAPKTPLTRTRVLSVPAKTIAKGTAPLAVTLSAPPAPGSPPPSLKPAVAGTWTTVGDVESFTAVSTLNPCTSYTLTIWSNTTAAGHSRLGHKRIVPLQVACPSLAGMQIGLARLGYIAANFRPRYTVAIKRGAETRREAAVHAYHPPHGRLAPDPADAPPAELGTLDETTKGAIEVYQADHDLEVTGEPNVRTWDSLLAAETANRRIPRPYTWVSVSESIPESLTLHEGHHVVLTTPANTGVPGAETEQGIFPIYSRFVSTTMTGTDPDGTHYVAPDVPWVNYFNGGDAVHGYPRASYGSPQSNGCVELPIETAHRVFEKLAIGDIVVVG